MILINYMAITRHFHLIVIASLIGLSVPVFANHTPIIRADVVDTILNLAYNCHFDRALRLVDDLNRTDSASIEWGFFRAFVLWQELIFKDSAGIEDRNIEAEFYNSIRQVIDTAKSRLSSNPRDTMSLFYGGFAFGYLAKFDAANGNKYLAAREGDKGLSYHKTLLAICPRWYDVYFSEALFNYYTSALPWYLKPIFFILGRSGSRDRAYELLSLVSAKGVITKYEAENVLGELYEREGKCDSSCLAFSKLTAQFPGASMYYSDRTAWAYTDANHYQDVVQTCKNALEKEPAPVLSAIDSLYREKIYFRLARAYEALGDGADATSEYEWLAEKGTVAQFRNEARKRLSALMER